MKNWHLDIRFEIYVGHLVKLFILSAKYTQSLMLWCWSVFRLVSNYFLVNLGPDLLFFLYHLVYLYLYLYSVEVDIDNGDGWKAALVTWSDRVGGWSPTSAANNTTWQLFETTFAKKCWIQSMFLQIVCQLQAHSVKGHCEGTVSSVLWQIWMSVNRCYHQPTRSESRGVITSNNCVLKSATLQRHISQTFRNNDILIEPSPPTWVPHPSFQWDAVAFLVLETSDLHPVHHLCDVCGGGDLSWGGGMGGNLSSEEGNFSGDIWSSTPSSLQCCSDKSVWKQAKRQNSLNLPTFPSPQLLTF